MDLVLVDEQGLGVVEGKPETPGMASVADAVRVVEACLSHQTDAALLYAENLTAGFFDLSSREAGEILQKLRNYQVRLAVVCVPGRVTFSSRFGDMLAEERRGRWFGVFETREAAVAWLRR